MWVSPRHPNPPRPAEPPAETGRRLGTFDRGDDGELRVCLQRYEGRPYISLRVWAKGWPVKGKGVSIRVREAAGLAAILADVVDQLGRDDVGGQRGPVDVGDRRRQAPPDRATTSTTSEPFDEFA